MDISIMRGQAFIAYTDEQNARNAEAGRDKPVVVAVGDTRIQLTKQEANDLAEIMNVWRDVSWRT